MVFKEGHETIDTEDAEAKDIKGEDIEVEDIEVEDIEEVGIKGEDVEAADIYELDEEGISAWSDITTPSSPILGVLADYGLLPSSSDVSTEFVDMINNDDKEVQGLPTLKWKAPDESGVGAKSQWKVARREEGGRLSDDGSGVETNDGNKLSQSVTVSRRLRESVRSGEFIADEWKKKRFKRRCIEKDQGVKFCYNAGWQVLHSKCSKWFKMSEPCNTTRFKIYIGTCKAKGSECNASIMSLFKPTNLNDAEAKAKITISGQANFHWE